MGSSEKKYDTKCPAVRRIMKESIELAEPTKQYGAKPLDDNLFEWHFTFKGSIGTDFEGGIYHGRIILPAEYPLKPPTIILLTPNGRFEIKKKVCLSISNHHPETWRPSWTIKTILIALVSFMPAEPENTIGSLECPAIERQILARKSRHWCCVFCGPISDLLPAGLPDQHLLLYDQMQIEEEEDVLNILPLEYEVADDDDDDDDEDYSVEDEVVRSLYDTVFKDIMFCLLVLLLIVCIYRRWSTLSQCCNVLFMFIASFFSN